MEPEIPFYDKETGKFIISLKTVKSYTSDETYVTGGKGSTRLPRAFTVNNVAGNEEFYSILLNRIGEELRFESDWINGVFNVSLDGEKIKLYEVI
jgi:hypothetical protein